MKHISGAQGATFDYVFNLQYMYVFHVLNTNLDFPLLWVVSSTPERTWGFCLKIPNPLPVSVNNTPPIAYAADYRPIRIIDFRLRG